LAPTPTQLVGFSSGGGGPSFFFISLFLTPKRGGHWLFGGGQLGGRPLFFSPNGGPPGNSGGGGDLHFPSAVFTGSNKPILCVLKNKKERVCHFSCFPLPNHLGFWLWGVPWVVRAPVGANPPPPPTGGLHFEKNQTTPPPTPTPPPPLLTHAGPLFFFFDAPFFLARGAQKKNKLGWGEFFRGQTHQTRGGG